MNTMILKTCLFILTSACILFFINGCDVTTVGPNSNVGNDSFVAKESFSFRITAENKSGFRLEAINGRVTIKGTSTTDSIIILGDKRVGSENMSDAQAHLSQLEVNMQDLSDEILIKTTQPEKSSGRSYVVDYNITLPDHLEISVILVNGIVSIDAINNIVSVNNVNGEIVLDNIIGSTFSNIINGQIKINQSLPHNGSINCGTLNGNIILDIPRNTSAEFSARTVNGNISASNLVFQNQVISPNSLQGTLSNGEGIIDLSVVNGNINVVGY